MISDIAVFWTSRAIFNSTLNQYVINDVIPPDEFHFGNNSAYTNAAVSLALSFATEAAMVLNESPPPIWSHIAENLQIPFDSQQQIHLEFDNYDGSEIKQADVILMGFPLGWPMTQQIRENDLVYYTAVTDPNGPAMTWSMTAIGYLELGQIETAATYFPQSFANIHPPFNIWLETPVGGATNFITGAGGFIQGVVYGYGGIRILSDQLDFNPTLPPNVTMVVYRSIDYFGNQFDFEFDENQMKFKFIFRDQYSPKLMVTVQNGTSVKLNSDPVFPRGFAAVSLQDSL